MKKSIMYQISYIIEVADTEIPNQDKREAREMVLNRNTMNCGKCCNPPP